VAGALIESLLSIYPRPVYLMCRSGLGPFYQKFGFTTLQFEQMPAYFQRASRVMADMEFLRQMQETLLVMRAA
jgi:hypothetical protein